MGQDIYEVLRGFEHAYPRDIFLPLTEKEIEAVIANDHPSWSSVLGPDGDKRIRQETAEHYRRYARLGDRLLANFVQFLKAY